MITINPYASPRLEAPASAARPKVRIDYFKIAENGFLCSVLSRAEVVELLRTHLIDYCTELDCEIVQNDPEYRIGGEFQWVEQGSRLLRSLLPWLAGAARVQVVCRITRGEEVVREIGLHQRKAIGFQGGNSRSLLELSIRQIALRLSSDVAVATGRSGLAESAGVATYLGGLVTVSAVISGGLAWLAYRWAMTLPMRRDGLSNSEKLWWAGFIALLLLAALTLLGLATAPNRVLTSRLLLFLRNAAGVKTVTAQRFVIALLIAAPIGLLYLCYLVL